jgi:hypothetical protein
MSQSDYLRFKKTSRLLKDIADFDPVLAPSDYIAGKDFNLETTITNSKTTYNRLKPSDKQIVFGMERTTGESCPTFELCTETNARPNRVALTGNQSACFPVMKAPGRSVPSVKPTTAKDSQFLKPNFNSYVRKNYRVRCECNYTMCVGSQSRTCLLKYGCTCMNTIVSETPVGASTFFSLGRKKGGGTLAGYGKTVK